MRITNFKIGARLSIGFGFLVLLLVAMAVLGITRLSGLNEQMDEVINDKYPKTVLANDIIKNVNVIARSSRNVLLMTDVDDVGKEMQTIRTRSRRQPGPVEPHRTAGQLAGRNRVLDGRTDRHRQAERRQCAPGEHPGRDGVRRRRAAAAR
jgi:hypothetical protein